MIGRRGDVVALSVMLLAFGASREVEAAGLGGDVSEKPARSVAQQNLSPPQFRTLGPAQALATKR